MADPLKAWEVLSSDSVVDGWPWLRVYQEHVCLPNGVEIPDYWLVEFPGYAQIFAVTPDRQVVLTEMYKHGPGIVSLELPAGGFEGEEEVQMPVLAAQREFLEETGMVADEWIPLGKFFVDGNRGCGWMHGFLALNATRKQEPQWEPTELMHIHLKSLAEVRRLWLDGSIANIAATALIGIALAHLESET